MPFVSVQVLGSHSRNQIGLAFQKWGFIARKVGQQIEESWRLGGRPCQGRPLPLLLHTAGCCGCRHCCWKCCQPLKHDRCPVQCSIFLLVTPIEMKWPSPSYYHCLGMCLLPLPHLAYCFFVLLCFSWVKASGVLLQLNAGWGLLQFPSRQFSSLILLPSAHCSVYWGDIF